ncbi:MAG: hypothetical protein HYR80_00600 [Nitrospirae bacterium]|nr:hypothetical protein [Nitrospirota bacterium]
MKNFLVMNITALILISIVSKAEARYGPYLSLDLEGNSRRVEENCIQCIDPNTGLPALKFYGNGDSTRLLARLGMDLRPLDIYLTFGGSTLTVNEFDGYHGQLAPTFGGGIKIRMYESTSYEHFNIFINPDIIYFKSSDTIQFISQSLGVITESHDVSWTEYGVKVGGSARYDFMEPYAGISVSFLDGEASGPVFGTADFKERDNLGFFLGANYYFDPTGQASLYGEIGGGDNGYVKVGIKTRF